MRNVADKFAGKIKNPNLYSTTFFLSIVPFMTKGGKVLCSRMAIYYNMARAHCMLDN